MNDDNYGNLSYSELMGDGRPFIRLKLDVDQPIELSEFVSAFTSLAAEYERFSREKDPETASTAAMFVREVRQGCIVAELIPVLGAIGGGLIGGIAAANTLHEFVERYGGRLRAYLKPKGRLPEVTKAELADFSQQVAAIASNPNSNLEVAAIEVENGEQTVRAAFKFKTGEAREIQNHVEDHKRELDRKDRTDHERVLMVFTRSDIHMSPVGKRSGEQVHIAAISDKPRPLIYASDLAERSIKHEITEAEDNVFRKGFVVDVNVELRGGKPVAYSVTNLHQVIDLPDDDN